MGSSHSLTVVKTSKEIMGGLNVEKELLEAYAFYSAIILAKMLLMPLLTARQRFATKSFISSEDIAGKDKDDGFTTGPNEDVERVRRAHQNDIENIFPFLFLGLLYILTNPAVATATLVFRIFVGARILHTIVYLLVIPQPARALAFFAGQGVNIYLAYKIITAFA